MLLLCLVIICLVGTTRALYILPRDRKSTTHGSRGTKSQTKRTQPCALAVFLGSGGHTSEALSLVSSLDFSRYSPRTYVISEGDTLSEKKALALELFKASDSHSYTMLTIPRARRVHQSLAATPLTAVYSFLICLYHVTFAPFLASALSRPPGPFPAEALILNGPGTCFVLTAAVYVNKFFGFPSPRIIYVETFARVRSLSLSAKLLRYLADRFVVQWPDNLGVDRKGVYRGWMV